MILVANINFQQDYFSYAFYYTFLFSLMQLLRVQQCFLISKVDFLEFLELCLTQILFYSPGFPSHLEIVITTAAVTVPTICSQRSFPGIHYFEERKVKKVECYHNYIYNKCHYLPREREKQTNNKETKTIKSSIISKCEKTKLLLKFCSDQGTTQQQGSANSCCIALSYCI